jgi:hypothetical protein
MIARLPAPGLIWQTVQYLVGFRRLGYDPYYVEAHGGTPRDLMHGVREKGDHGSAEAAAFIASIMRQFDFEDRWVFHSRFDGDRYCGLTEAQTKALYRSAALIINYHGSTVPLPEHAETGRLVYLETDPVGLEIELHRQYREALTFVAPHRAFFTWGLNYGNPDCKVPMPDGLTFRHSPPAILPDLWDEYADPRNHAFTTVGNWRQPGAARLDGEVYHWSKHLEFLKFIDLPSRTSQTFELALGAPSYTEEDFQLLASHGWRVLDAAVVSGSLPSYRQYVCSSRAEFTVAKDQNVRLRSGWFSERSATYLAAGRPVVTQETGFSNVLPTGCGLFGFSTMDDILEAVDAINSDYATHSRAAIEIARDYFSYEVVLPRLLNEVGV